jgi:prepilin-type N-terminal cleavage/methylation domain-containing protein
MMLPEPSRRGFTLLELIVVMAIIMVIAAMATPSLINAVNAYKLRTAAGNLAGIIQRTRMQAVSDDRWYPVHMGASGSSSFAFTDLDKDFDLDTNEQATVAYLPRGIAFDSSGGPSLTSMGLDFTPVIGLPAFNARGLPCNPSGAVCNTLSGYIYYLRQDRPFGGPSWAALTVSPAGRVKVWTWNGSAWN